MQAQENTERSGAKSSAEAISTRSTFDARRQNARFGDRRGARGCRRDEGERSEMVPDRCGPRRMERGEASGPGRCVRRPAIYLCLNDGGVNIVVEVEKRIKKVNAAYSKPVVLSKLSSSGLCRLSLPGRPPGPAL